MTPTPKIARQHRRKASTRDHTRNDRAFRVEASWNHSPDRPQFAHTSDKAKVRRIARQWTEQGAYVIVSKRDGYQWRTVDEYDGPALAAERRTAERTAVEQARLAAQAAEQRLAAAEQAEAEHDALARLMARPPVARDATGRAAARHRTGAQRP